MALISNTEQLLTLSSTKKQKKSGLSSVLVVTSGDGSDDEAVKLACELLDPQRGRLYVAYIIEVERALPVDAEVAPATAKGEEVLKHMEEVAEDLKFEAEAELLQARSTGPAIVGEAFDKQVDAIVLTIPHRKRYGSFHVGDTAPYVLEHAPCKVILWRNAIAGTPSSNGARP